MNVADIEIDKWYILIVNKSHFYLTLPGIKLNFAICLQSVTDLFM